MISQTVLSRIEDLENQVKFLLSQIPQKQAIPEFIPTSEAAKVLGVANITLLRQIKRAKGFPEQSPFKIDIHWKQYQSYSLNHEKPAAIRYLINPVAWREVCTKVG